MAAGAVSLRKSHDIVILSFCNVVKGQAIYWVIYGENYFAANRTQSRAETY